MPLLPPSLAPRAIVSLQSSNLSHTLGYGQLTRMVAASGFRQRSLRPRGMPHFRCINEGRNGNAWPSDTTNKPGSRATTASTPRVPILDQLGASRPVKITIIICLCIFGTMETVFYAKAAMRYFDPPEEHQDEESD
ncbi:uncharacterized protein CIMG_12134 [Coccidioides immitis RS]|uniref:Uncharacterized protein n=4 Tax=Coccidioides immitis TaxID=5501 RepID=A0A0D8JTY0_COCIM|nr:uncharacterized protein CIMG_12134 [Coccidioides immitis RS]KMP06633.1 hypothetical protein CIRG_06314 [Coccidioides immitis RMSCC 2394]KMU73680.1 hypothetical protein CISG_03730 [Coccidioides immitis RMSCC 3703]KMU84210.1 hypothetical protein CIHG_01996 [Coccidioides immitis H538.4]TPX22437.1 hypothetical protein DIZ76_014309 [Coccidioides immitis]KJF60800.1 hypothetical protein CIMG_12134 [Coccidioides immitis RS]